VTGRIRLVPRNLSTLQAGRAIAAILVVLFHDSARIFSLPQYWGTKPFGRLFDFGDSGVFFFFVLSGFIILHAHYRDLDQPTRVKNYVWKRFRRIYPFYWVVLFLTLLVYFSVGRFRSGTETHPDVILDSFLLLHLYSLHTVIMVSWTLFHEILFYALFALAIWRRRLGFTVLGAWLALSVVSMTTDRSSMLFEFYFSPLHLLFGFGMAATWLMQRGSVPLPSAIVALGVTVFLLTGADEVYWHLMAAEWRTLVFGLGAMLAMIGLVELECGGRLKIPAWLRLLGDASYSIYLVHYFVLWFFAKLFWVSGVAFLLPAAAAFVLLACLAVAAGVLCHLWIERPLLVSLGQNFTLARA
jgi:exopolysaccharide production protein ExoZ